MGPVLAASFHVDEVNIHGWAPLIKACAPMMREIFDHAVVAMNRQAAKVVCPETGGAIADAFLDRGLEVIIGADELGRNHEAAIRRACLGAGPRKAVLYCDFDRVAHWAQNAGGELVQVAGRLDETSILTPCRSGMPVRREDLKARAAAGSAWDSHPITQRATEGPATVLINEMLNAQTAAEVRADPFGTVLGAGPMMWELLLSPKFRPGFPQGVWCARILQAIEAHPLVRLESICVHGLGFETLDRLAYVSAEDRAVEPEKAFRELEASPHEALRRSRVASDIVQSVLASSKHVDADMSRMAGSFIQACAELEVKLRSEADGRSRRALLDAFQANALSDDEVIMED